MVNITSTQTTMALNLFSLYGFVSYLLFPYVSLGSSDSSSGSSDEDSTTISAQLFCDNYYKFYFNGQEIINDDAFQRTVVTGLFEATKGGTRTFALWLADSPVGDNNGFSIRTQSWAITQDDGSRIESLMCPGGGGVVGVFSDDECGETVVTNSDCKCEAVRFSPANIEECFQDGWTTNPYC